MKRFHLPAVTAAVMLVTLAACSSGGTSAGDMSTDGASASQQASGSTAASSDNGSSSTASDADGSADVCSATPVSGGTLTSARQNETLSLNPGNTPGGWGDGEAINLIFEPLIAMDPTGETSDIVPAVADEWSAADDGLSYTFHIRDGITFSNGDPVTAEDVKFSLDRFADPDKSQLASFAAGYESTDILSAQDVKVNLSEVKGGFPYSLAMIGAAILPKALVEQQGDAFWENPIGTGPFTLDSWTKGSSITFAKNAKYWNPELPRLDKLVWNFIKDDSTRLRTLVSGQVQTIDSVPWSEIANLKNNKDIVVDSFAIGSWVYLALNTQKPVLQDVNVRQALSLAIDREAINEKIYGGLASVPNSVMPRVHYDADDATVKPFAHDIAKAKELLAQSAHPDGFDATLEFPNSSPAIASLAAVLQAEWAELGIKVELRPEDQATLSKNRRGGTYDLMIPYALAATDVPIPDEFGTYFAVPGPTNGFYSWWSDASIQAKFEEFTGTTDDKKRAELWPEVQAALAEQMPAINVLDLPLVKARAANVCGTVTSPIGYDSTAFAWIAN